MWDMYRKDPTYADTKIRILLDEILCNGVISTIHLKGTNFLYEKVIMRNSEFNDRIPSHIEDQLNNIGEDSKALFKIIFEAENIMQHVLNDKSFRFNFSKTELVYTNSAIMLELYILNNQNPISNPIIFCKKYGFSFWKLETGF